MIRVELKLSGASIPDQVEIALDQVGLKAFLAQLDLLKSGKTEHIDLMSEEWGGNHLTIGPPQQGRSAIHHLKILLR